MARPSHFHLALALAIVKTRPIGLTIRTYLNKIQKNILEGNAVQDYSSEEKYIDAVRYWQSMYQKSRDENEELLNEISNLQQQRKTLETRLIAARQAPELTVAHDPVIKQEDEVNRLASAQGRPATAQPKSTLPKRRKNPFKDEGRSQLQHKKLKTVPVPDAGTAEAPLVISDDLARFDDNKALSTAARTLLHDKVADNITGESITRHLLQAHKFYQKPSHDYSALSHHLVFIAREIGETISIQALDVQKQLKRASALPKDKGLRSQRTTAALTVLNTDFRRAKHASARAFMSLYHCLETLWGCRLEQGKRVHGMVSYEMICTVGTLLETIEKACAIQATIEGDELVPRYNKAVGLIKKRKDKRVDLAPVPQEVTTLTLALLSGLTPKMHGPHSAFFEGCLYLLLELVANRLYVLTFGHEQAASIEEEIKMDDDENKQLDLVKMKALNLEIQFLTQLVDRAMGFAPSFLGSLAAQKNQSKNVRPGSSAARPASAIRPATGTKPNTATGSGGASKSGSKASLSIGARERLQNTLVRCMFGPFPRLSVDDHSGGESETVDEEGSSRNNEFVDVLRKPVPMGAVPQTVMKVEERDVKEWFREEMWRMVGWEVLGRDDGW